MTSFGVAGGICCYHAATARQGQEQQMLLNAVLLTLILLQFGVTGGVCCCHAATARQGQEQQQHWEASAGACGTGSCRLSAQ